MSIHIGGTIEVGDEGVIEVDTGITVEEFVRNNTFSSKFRVFVNKFKNTHFKIVGKDYKISTLFWKEVSV